MDMQDAPVRILIVDDDEVDRISVRRTLEQSGLVAEVEEASSAAEALEHLAGDGLDCILLDYYLPATNGLAILQRIRESASGVPVIMFTGRGDEEMAVEFMKAGAADYLPKASLSPERLEVSIRRAIELSRAAAARRRAEEELRAQEARFRTLANAIPQITWIADANGNVSWFNDRFYQFTGRSEPPEGGWRTIIHPDHLDRVVNGLRQAIASGEPWEDTFPMRGGDGQYRWFLSRAVPLRRPDGTIEGWFGANTDVTDQREAAVERERLLALEQQARSEAEHATRLRDEVLAIVAHDLRNPIHAIMAAASMMVLPVPEERRQRHLAIIKRSTKEMDALISDLLDVSRIESGRFAIEQAPVPVRELFDDAVTLFESQAAERGITIEADLPPDLPLVFVERARLVQLLSNLLSNALKFTEPGGRVVLRARVADRAVQISVTDSGSGIPLEHQAHIFDRFWQAQRSSRAGAGLGLAICKGIAEAHGGRIWVESTPGQGATFHVIVPGAAEGHAEPAAAGQPMPVR